MLNYAGEAGEAGSGFTAQFARRQRRVISNRDGDALCEGIQ